MNTRIEEIAGYMSERHVWQLLHEIASALLGAECSHHTITASRIAWDERRFSLLTVNDEAEDAYRFEAPEASRGQVGAASYVWSLGAVAFYMYMGCHVFNGRGGASQTVDSPVPFMRKDLKDLSETLQRCLSFDPQKRPTAAQLCETAKAQLKRLQTSVPRRELKAGSDAHIVAAAVGDFWPEEMTDK